MNVHSIRWDWGTDPAGVPLALVVYTNRTCKAFYHSELGKA